MKLKLQFLIGVLLMLLTASGFAQTTYTWTGAIDNTWGTSGNWSPNRVSPATSDILVFNDGGTYTITGVGTQTIRQLLVSSFTSVTLEASGTNTLSLNGPAATDNLSIANGSQLGIGSGTNTLSLSFAITGNQQANIAGTLVLGANSNLGSAVATSVFTVSGSVTVNSGANFNSTNANISFGAGSTYTHARNGGSIPSATWDNASNCVITGITNAALSGGWAQNFGNVLWNCTGQSVAHGVAGPTNIAGTFELRNTNAQYVSVEAARVWSGNLLITGGRFAVRNVANATFNLQVNNFTLDNTTNANARFSVYAGSFTTAYTNNLNVEGDFNLILNQNAAASPVIEYRGSATTTLQENINLKGNFTQTGTGTGTIGRSSGGSVASFNFTGTALQTYSAARNDLWGTLSAMTVGAGANVDIGSAVIAPSSATFTMGAGSTLSIGSGSIANGGTFTMTTGATTLNIGSGSVSNVGNFTCGVAGTINIAPTGTIANTGTFALGTTAVLGIGSADGIAATGGFTGNIQSTSTRTYPATATYVYQGVADQVTGNGLPATLTTGSVVINNPGSTVSLSQNLSWSGAGTLNLQSGRLQLDGFSLNLAATTNLIGSPFSAANMVVTNSSGQIIRSGMVAGSTFTFPIGDQAGTYAPVTFGLPASSVARNIGARVIDAIHPDIVANPVANHLNRYWSISASTITGTYTYSLQTGYSSPADVTGSQALIKPSLWNGSSWLPLTGTAAANVLTFSGTMNNATAPLSTAGTEFSGREGSLLYYRSIASGNWTNPAIWEVDTDPGFGSAVGASSEPTSSNSALVIVSNGTTVQVGAPISALDILVKGTLENTSTLTTIFNGVTGGVSFDANAIYLHSANGGVVPTASWDVSSFARITGITTATTLNGIAGQSFGNWEHNSAGQTSAFSYATAAAGYSFKGDFTLLDAGSGSMSFKSGTAAVTVTVEGDLIVDAGSVIANSGGTAGLTLNVLGDFDISGGSFNLSNAAIACVMNLSGNFNQTGGDFTQSSTTVSTVNWLGASQSFSSAGGTFNGANLNHVLSGAPAASLSLNSAFTLWPSRTFTVNAGGTLILGSDITINGTLTQNGTMQLGGFVVNGTGSFVNTAATSTLEIGHPDGINLVATGAIGNIQTNTRTFGAIGVYIYIGASAQNTGTGLPATITTGSVQINNSNGVTLSQNTTISGAGNLTLTNGRFRLANANFTLGATALLNGAPFGVNKMIVTDGTGQLINVSGTTAFSFTYPVGDELGVAEYSPITFNFSVNSAARTIGVRAVGAQHPNNYAGTPHYLNRYWAITSTVNTNNYTLAVTTDYSSADVSGTESLLEFSHFNNATALWSTYPATIGSNTITASGIVNTTSNFLQTGFDLTGRSSTPAFYRSAQDGNWNDVATWEVSANLGGPYSPAAILPTAVNSDRIQVQSGHTVTITATVSVDDVVISGNLIVNSGVVFTAANGLAAEDLLAEGGSVITNNGTITVAALANARFEGLITNNLTLNFNTSTAIVLVNGTINNTTNGSTNGTVAVLTFGAGSVYDHQRNAGALPLATWNAAATTMITGIITTMPTNISGGNFGNFIHNASGQTAALSYAITSTATTIKGDYTLESTGSGSLSFKSGTSAATLTVNGNFIVNNGTLNANIGGTAGLTLTINGNYSQTGGSFNLSTAAIACILNLDGNFNQTNGTFTQTSVTVSTFNFRGIGRTFSTTGGTYTGTNFNYVLTTTPSLASLTINSAFTHEASRTFTINAGTTLTLGSNITSNGTITNNGSLYLANYVISGTGIFAHNTATSFLYIGHAQGISSSGLSGNIQTSGTRTFGATAHYIYYGTVDQITGSGLPASPSTGSISIDNSGVVDLSQATTISGAGALNLLQGRFRLGNNNFTLSATATLGGNTPGSSNMIVTNGSGQFFRGFTTAVLGPFLYPIGDDGGNYSPANFGFVNTSTSRNIGMRVVDAAHPGVTGSDYITRYWAMTASSNTGTYAYTLDLTYVNGDVVGNAASMIGSLWYNPSASVWAPKATSLSGNTLSFVGTLNNLTAPLGTTPASATDFTGHTGFVTYYRSIANGNWADPVPANVWEVSNDITFPPAFTDPATVTPSAANSAKVIISAGTNIEVNTAVTVVDMDVEGTITRTGGTIGISGTAAFKPASVYNHAINGGVFISATLPGVVTWDATSTAIISGTNATTGTVNLTGLSGQTLGNLEYDSPGQGASILNFGIAANTTIQGNFLMKNSGTGSLQMATGAYNLFILGDFNQTGGSLNRGTASAPVWNVDGDYLQSGGIHTQTSTTAGTTNFRGVGKSYNISGGTYTATNINYTVSGTPAASITLNSNIGLLTSRTLVVNAGGTLILGSNQTNTGGAITNNGTMVLSDYVISGTGTFVNNAATSFLQIGHQGGISTSGATGNIQSTGARTFGATSHYIYNGTLAQITGNGFPAAPSTGSLTINNTAGVQLSQNTAFSGAGAFNLQSGILDLGNFNLTLIATTVLGGNAPSASNMVVSSGTGQFIRAFPTGASTFTFPVGDNSGVAEFSPVTLEFTANSVARNIGIRVVDDRHPQDILLPDYLSRYWAFSNTGAGTHTANVTFTYLPSDVNGNISNIGLQRYDVNAASPTFTQWAEYATAQSGNDLTLSGVNNFLLPTANYSFDFTGRSAIQPLYYRSRQSGNWNDLSTWEVSTDPNFSSPAPVLATLTPTAANAFGILVQTPHTVTVTASLTSIDDLIVDGTLTINNAITFTIVNGAAAVDFTLNGTVNNSGTLNLNTASSSNQIFGTLVNTGANGIINGTVATLALNAGATYNHNRNGGALTLATWDVASTLEITGITTTQMTTGLGAQSFGTVVYNSTGQSGTGNLSLGASTGMIIKGDLIIQSTGTSTGSTVLGTTGGAVTINGNWIHQGGRFNVATTTAYAINLDGDFLQSGGDLFQTLTTLSTFNFRGVDKVYNQTGGTVTGTNFSYALLNTPNPASLTLNAPLVLAGARTFTVNAGTTLTLGSNITVNGTFTNNGTTDLKAFVVSGTGSVVNSAATSLLKIGSTDGITTAPTASGNIQTTTRTMGTAANYEFNGIVAQNSGNGLPASMASLRINNANGVTLNANLGTITNTLFLDQGQFILDNFNFTMGTNALVDGNTPGVNNMVVTNGTGQMICSIPASAWSNPYFWPIGTSSQYNPVLMSFTTTTTAGTLGARVVSGAHPLIGSAADYLNAYWEFTTPTGLTTYTLSSIVLGYNNAQVVGTETGLTGSYLSGSAWNAYPSNVDVLNNTITFSSTGTLNQLSAPLNNSVYTGRTGSIAYYRSIASGNWNAASTWEVANNPSYVGAVPATSTPTAENNLGILIRGGHTVTVTADVDADQLTIENVVGANLTIASGVNFSLLDGLGNDLVLAGTNARLFVGGLLINNGQITGASTTTMNVQATGTYEHAQNGGIVPTSTWTAGSTCLISGVTANAPTGLNQTFRNFTWNTSGLTVANLSLAGALTNVTENLSWINTGTGSVALNTLATTLTVGGDLIITNGVFNLNAGAAVATTFNLAGNYNQTGGELTCTATGVSLINFTGAGRTYTQSGGVVSNAQINYQINTAAANLTLNDGITLGSSRTFNLLNGTLNLGTAVIDGAGSFSVSSVTTANVFSGSPQGLQASANSGNIQVSGTRNFGILANYIFNGTVPQNTGDGVTGATTLTINNAAGVTAGGTISTVNLVLSAGRYNTSSTNYVIVTGVAGTPISGTLDGTACVSGPMERVIPANRSTALTLFFPLGKAGAYNPVEVINPTTGASGVVHIRAEVFNGATGGSGGAGLSSLNANRFWEISASVNSANLTNQGSVRLTETSPVLVNGTHGIGQSATQTGTYAFKGGLVSGNTIQSQSVLNPGYGFFAIGTIGPITCPSPILTVGPGGDFINLTDAAAVLNGLPINCNLILELSSGYTSAGEAFPVTLNQFTYGAGGPFTLTIRPASGATPVISGNAAGGILVLNGADNVIVDGRQGGVGAPHSLVMTNANTSGSTIQYINDAQNNIVRFVDVRGSASATTNGVIVIGTSSAGSGNDNITISNNLINGGTPRPANLIYAVGSSTRDNNGIVVSDNNFFNWGLSSTAASAAVSVNSNNHSWTISGNSFYLPTSWTSAGNIFGIDIGATAAANSNFTVSNNFIGGDGPLLGSNFWSVNTSSDYRFCGIALNVSTTGTSVVQNNSISRFSLISSTSFQTQSSAFTGIFAQGGNINIASNNIGSTTSGYDIIVTPTGFPITSIHGIFHSGNVDVNINNNTIIGIQSNGSMNSLYGIRASTSAISGTMNISNNQIGSLSGSIGLINNSGVSYSGTGTAFTAGIHVSGARPATITDNLVKDIVLTTNATSSGAGSVRTVGIYRENGSNNVIQNNIVRNIRSASQFSGTGVNAAVSGINANVSTGPGINISNNLVHTIESEPTSPASTNAVGILVSSPATSVVNQALFTEDFSTGANWTLNVVTGAEGSTPNPWEIGSAVSCNPYPGGACGASNSRGLYIRCNDFLCNLIGGGCPVFNASTAANITDRAAHLNTNISSINYSNLSLNFAWRCVGATSAYGQVRYSTDGGSTWVDLPTQYRAQSAWQCANIALPAACENIPNLRIGFKWVNGTAGADPPIIITNVEVRGDLQTTAQSVTERNNIHSVVNNSISSTAVASGIQLVAGTNLAYNNFVRLGIRPDGSSQSNGTIINGINITAGNASVYHNSVYVGGSGVGGSSNTFALYSNSTGSVSSLNNILFNARSNGAGSGKHYSHRFNTLSNLTSDYNLLMANGNGAVLGAIGVSDYNFLPYWHQSTGSDLNSVTGDPIFVNATGSASTVDLHIAPSASTPIESAGIAIGTVSVDIDSESRASNTPTDIGADAGLFIPVDITPPSIVYTPINSQALCSGTTTTTVEVNIVDNQTGLSTVSNLPRMYFRRKTGAPTTAWSTTNSVAGVFLSGTAQNSNWEFTIDYAAFGITVNANDEFEYYFVAQDQASTPNVGVSQTNGSTPVHPSVAVMTTAPAFVFPANGFYVFNGTPLSGVVTVGVAGDYPSFNGVTGLFNAINTWGIAGDLDVRVISDISEISYTPLNKQTEFCGSGYKIRITPNSNVTRTITGTNGQTMIDINGAFSLTVDGRDQANLSAGGRHLIFRNNSSFPAIRFNNGASNDSVMYCQVQSRVQNSTQGSGVITIGGPLIVGNQALDNIVLFENRISWPSNIGSPVITDIPQVGVQFRGSASSSITNLQIRRNSVFNFQTTAIGTINPTTGTGNSFIGNGAVIDSNRVYQTFNIPTYQYPIVMDVNGLSFGHRITNNLIGGNAEPSPNITGTLANNKSDGEMIPIFVNVGNAPDSLSATSIQGNQIKNILLSGTGWGNFIGIRVQNGRVRIGDEKRNVIGDSLIANNVECRGGGTLTSLTGNSAIMGIWTQSSEEVVIANNLIANLTASAPVNGFCFVDGIAHGSNLYFNDILFDSPGGRVIMRNNRVDFVLSASRLQNSAISSEGFMGYFVYSNANNNIIENNVLINSGVNNLVNRNVRVHGMHIGIYGSLVNQGGRVSGNTIASLANTATGDNTATILPEINGLVVAHGNWNVFNNQVFIRNGTSGTPITNTNTLVVGIRDGLVNQAGQAANYYNNTVYVSGTNGGSGPGNASYAFLRFPNNTGSVAGAPVQLRNNLFVNDRIGIGNHRVLGNVTSASPATGWNATASNYNRFFNNTSGITARWGTTDYTLAGFQTASGGDANSGWIQTAATTTATTLFPYDLFTNPLQGSLKVLLTNPTAFGFVDALGTPVAAVSIDFEGDPRDPVTPDPGADEFSICQNPVVTTQPANQSVCEGVSLNFNVVNTGLAPFTYAWEISTDGGTNWNPLSNAGVYSGADTDQLDISTSTGLNGNQYRVQITNTCSTIVSNAATLTVLSAPAITAYSPPSFVNNVCALSNTGFGVTATGDGLTYQWEVSEDGGTSWNNVLNNATYSGATAATMFISNTPASFHENQYRVTVSGTCPIPVTSIVGTLNVGEVTLNTQPPATTVVCDGGTTTITVGASGNSLVYQWQLSTNNGASFSPLSNAGVYSGVDTQTLTITGATLGMTNYQYRIVIGSVACPSVTSNASTLGVNPLLSTSVSITAAPGDEICDGTEVTFTATPVNGGGTPSYQWFLNGSPAGTNAATFVISTLADNDQVNVEMTSSATCPTPALSTSNTITMTVNPILPASVSISTASTTVCQGSNITFTATPVNGGSTPTYAWTINGSPAGTNSASFSTTALVNGDVVEVEMTSSETCVSGSPASSNSIPMTVQFVGQWLGFTTDWNTASNWGCGVLPTISTVVNLDGSPVGGNQPIVSSSLTALVRDLNMAVGSSVLINSGADLSVYGNIDNQGDPNFGDGTIIFAGNDLHSVGGANILSIGSIVVNNAAPGLDVQLNQTINISDNLTMTAGTLDLNGFDIDFGTTGELVGETNSNRVFGAGELKSVRTLAASTSYTNIAGLGVSIVTDATAPGVTAVERGHESQAVSANNSIRRYFDINPTVNSALNATLRIAYFEDELADIDAVNPIEDQLIPWRSEDNGTTWEGQHFPARLSNDNVANWVQLTQIPAFSRWTLSDWLTEPLPIQLLHFNAVAAGEVVNLEWATASETNNDFFTVERSSNAQHFEAVLQRDGAGNSNSVRVYNDVDPQPLEGLSYYRLKQTDFNGEFSYSQVVPVYFGNQVNAAVNAWVNADGNIVSSIRSRFDDKAVFELFDIAGRIVCSQTADLSKGSQQLLIYPGQLSEGVYMLSIRGKHIEHVQKIMLK